MANQLGVDLKLAEERLLGSPLPPDKRILGVVSEQALPVGVS